MGSRIHRLQTFATCRGRGLVLGRLRGVGDARTFGASAESDVALVLASISAEDDATAQQACTVVLHVRDRDDSSWAATAVDWLSERGRRVLLRTCVRLSNALVDAADRWGATVMLDLAHGRPDLQRALLGSAAEPATALLLHAQHLRSRDIEVVAGVGPLLPTLHDRTGAAASLMHHVVAADVCDAHLSIGRLGPSRFEALAQTLAWADVLALARAYDLPIPPDRGWPVVAASGARLGQRSHTVFHLAMRRLAEDCGLRVDHCGCPAACHLDPGLVPEYVPLRTHELFAVEAG
jgi:nucleotide-binding universal stress UspA family protein